MSNIVIVIFQPPTLVHRFRRMQLHLLQSFELHRAFLILRPRYHRRLRTPNSSGNSAIHFWVIPIPGRRSSTNGRTRSLGPATSIYVMFLSGPTDPTDGSSIQDVQAFVLSLDTQALGSTACTIKIWETTKNGFGGRLFTSGLDVNSDGYTDFVFFGYGNSPTGSPTGWQGGIGKIFTSKTKIDVNGLLTIDYTTTDPSSWHPGNWDVTTYSRHSHTAHNRQVATEQCFNNWYLYSGTGRYFFPAGQLWRPAIRFELSHGNTVYVRSIQQKLRLLHQRLRDVQWTEMLKRRRLPIRKHLRRRWRSPEQQYDRMHRFGTRQHRPGRLAV